MKNFFTVFRTGGVKLYDTLVINDDQEKRRNRRIIIGVLLVFIYTSICLITGRSPFSVFRSLPVLDKRIEITVFFPDIDGKTVFEETRKILPSHNYEVLIREMVGMILKGSNYENTRLAAPFEGIIRSIWIEKDRCIIDFRLSIIDDTAKIIPGSETIFRDALSKTIKKNIPGINEVIIMENGIYGRNLWEMKAD